MPRPKGTPKLLVRTSRTTGRRSADRLREETLAKWLANGRRFEDHAAKSPGCGCGPHQSWGFDGSETAWLLVFVGDLRVHYHL